MKPESMYEYIHLFIHALLILYLENVSNGSLAPVSVASILLAARAVLKPALTVIGDRCGPIGKEQLLHMFNPAAASAAAVFLSEIETLRMCVFAVLDSPQL